MFKKNKNNIKNKNIIKFITKFLVVVLFVNISLETKFLNASVTCDSANKPDNCNLATLYPLISGLFKDIHPSSSDFNSDYCKYINHINPANLDTVLMSAAATGKLDAVNALISCNANPDFKNHKEYTALDFAQLKLSSDPTTYQPILNSLKKVTTCRNSSDTDNSCLYDIDCCSGTCDPTSKTCQGSGPSCANKGESCTIDSNCCTGLTCQSGTCATPSSPTCAQSGKD